MAWMQNYEHPDKKNSIKDDIFTQRKSNNKQTDLIMKQEKFLFGLKKWVSYWRANPHRFVLEYLQINPFSLFQKILVFLMFQNDYFLWWASRGLGKSHLTALYCIVRCILYPGTKICIAAKNRNQSLNIISEKIQGFYDNFPNVAREICELKTGSNDPIVKFYNSSWIKIVTAKDSARSARANVLIVDEFRLVDNEIIKKVLRKFLTSRRQPGYLKHIKYKGLQEPNTEIYLSSIGMKSEWSFDKFLAFESAMINGKKYFTCGFPYQLGIKHGIIDQQRMIDEITEDDYDPISFSMEMECLPFGESDKAHYKFQEMNSCREIKKATLPLTTDEFIQYKGDRRKNKFYQQKKENEIRILAMDIALMSGKENDNTAFILIRLLPNGDEYIKIVSYVETANGENTSIQALRLKQLFYDLECDYCVMDAAGNGLGVYDECTRIIIDTERGTEYPSWMSMNDEKMQERAIDKKALPIIYSIKVAGASANEVMHQMAVYTKTQFEKKKIKLLVSEIEAKEYLVEQHNYLKLESFDQARLIAAYYQVSKIISEAINLEKEYRSGFIKLTEMPGRRKDRISALMYGLYYVRILESDLQTENTTQDFSSLFNRNFNNYNNKTTPFGITTKNPFASKINPFVRNK
jgi:hypothetical protein